MPGARLSVGLRSLFAVHGDRGLVGIHQPVGDQFTEMAIKKKAAGRVFLQKVRQRTILDPDQSDGTDTLGGERVLGVFYHARPAKYIARLADHESHVAVVPRAEPDPALVEQIEIFG